MLILFWWISCICKEYRNVKKAYLMNTTSMAGRRHNISTVQTTVVKKARLYCSKNRDRRDRDGFSESHMRPFMNPLHGLAHFSKGKKWIIVYLL